MGFGFVSGGIDRPKVGRRSPLGDRLGVFEVAAELALPNMKHEKRATRLVGLISLGEHALAVASIARNPDCCPLDLALSRRVLPAQMALRKG